MPSKKAASKAAPEAAKFNINLPVERFKTAEFFDGQVKVTMWGFYSGEVGYASGALKRAVRDVPPPNPEIETPSDEAMEAMTDDQRERWAETLAKFDPMRSHFDTFATIIPYLVDIEFSIRDEQVEEELYYLHDWWVNNNAKSLLKSRNYEALWVTFRQYIMGRMIGVMLAAWYSTRRETMPASAGVAVGAAAKGVDDPSFLADGSTTSQSFSGM